VEMLEFLTRHGANINYRSIYNDRTSLDDAIHYGQLEVAEWLLQRGANPEDITDTLVAYACRHKGAAIELLLRYGADVNGVFEGATALHRAAMMDVVEAVQVLLKHGAHVDAADDEGDTPLHEAAARGYKSLQVLLAHGADVSRQGHHGYTPLHLAAEWGNRSTIELLLAHGADPAALNDRGQTPAQVAEQHEHHEIACLLRSP